MAMKVEEVFPSFSTERIRSKMHILDGPVTQRRLDYNAPLLSARRLADSGGDGKRKVWKLSAELSKEPLRVPGAVPFTWEHSPGRPKQPDSLQGKPTTVSASASKSPPSTQESPPRSPSSPSPPSTPSPPSARRASPASPPIHPPPPLLRPLFLRSNSSILFAPPPPPPPPPPPLPSSARRPPMTARSRTAPHEQRSPASSSHTAPPPPPLPPPPPPPPPPRASHATKPFIKASTSTAHDSVKAFRMVDPTEDLLRALRARREKLEPEAFLTTGTADEASDMVIVAADTAHANWTTDANSDTVVDKATVGSEAGPSCGVVDAIVQRFLADHPDISADEEASRWRQDGEAHQGDKPVILHGVQDDTVPCKCNSEEDDVAQHGKHMLADGIDPNRSIEMPSQMDAPTSLQVCPSEAANGEAGMHAPDSRHRTYPCAFEEGKTKPAVVTTCVSARSSAEAAEVQTETGHKQSSVVKNEQSKRRTSSIALLDSCRVESFRMIKSALVRFCRKAAAASLRTLGRAKRMVVVRSRRSTANSLEVAVHSSGSAILHDNAASDRDEERAVVARELESIPTQERRSTEQGQEVQNHPTLPPPTLSLDDMSLQSTQLHEEEVASTAPAKQDMQIPTSPPVSSAATSRQATSNSSETQDTVFLPPPDTTLSPEGSLGSHTTVGTSASSSEPVHAITSPKHGPGSPNSHSLTQEKTEEPSLHTPMQEEIQEPRLPSRRNSVRHVYAKSLGGDEPNEFYDASSRFGSQSSTPSRVHLNRSMSRDWSHSDEFLDATSSPFETPRNSVSGSPSMASIGGFRNKPTSKLSKRVGKALWVDTTEANAAAKTEALSAMPVKHFYSGEQFPKSKKNLSTAAALSKEDPLPCPRRKCVSGDQGSASTSLQARRNYKRGGSGSPDGKSAPQVLAVTPIFPSKCQKNRMMASASGLPRQILPANMQDVGWPLGISGYPLQKTCAKERAGKQLTNKKGSNAAAAAVVPSPPLPPSPAGGSWLRKTLSSSTLNQAPSRLAVGLQIAKKPSSPTPNSATPTTTNTTTTTTNNKWEDIVKGSHIQAGHLRFSEELQHQPPNLNSQV